VPEYLTPGVYVEETSFRAKSIEGVPTSTTGMAGLTRYGPVPYPLPDDDRTLVPEPTLVTNFTEFERAFGGLEDVQGETNYLAYAARAFFANGGRRLYVSRVFPWPKAPGSDDPDPAQIPDQIASRPVSSDGTPAGEVGHWRARWPGLMGNEIKITVGFTQSRNVITTTNGTATLTGLRAGALVQLLPAAVARPPAPTAAQLRLVARNGDALELRRADGTVEPLVADMVGVHVQLIVTVTLGTDREDAYTELAVEPEHPRSIFKVLDPEDPADEHALVWFQPVTPAPGTPAPGPADLCAALLRPENNGFLTGGSDGAALEATDLRGKPADPDVRTKPATGLEALGEVDDIAIVAMPDTVRFDADTAKVPVDDLIGHCERLRYRIAIVDPPNDSSISQVREFRNKFDTKYAALYYPWVEVIDPTRRPEPGAPPPKLWLPPSGFVAGIYARSDIERGVHKAPANEVVLGITRFRTNVTFDRQSVLNPEGVNALRFFEGRSNRVWGARTMTSDPEWKYVNVRRLFIYLEHSIDKATQWAVFEPNNERLWASIRRTIEDFLLVVWRTGALMGTKPEEAFFVRCDRTTMTQNDLDNGRMICLIGVAPTYPAEFVIFRIGQWTADARQN
jgi:phage tail sheath protein FI